MRNTIADWFDHRSGLRSGMRSVGDETMPGGARWMYVSGAALASIFLIQAFTGLMMMTAYSPSSSTAWGSVFFIEKQMWMGWFIRGLHHFGAQTLMVLLLLHFLQVLWAGAYRAPRELNWWIGLGLAILILAFSHTGYQLPWDQKGYWATKVVTNIMGGAPVAGPYVKTIVVGGTEYGNQTVTRFYGLHVGVLPFLMFLGLAAHVTLRRRHGFTPANYNPDPKVQGPVQTYWPDQVYRNLLVVTAILGVMIALVIHHGGAPLDAPADPSSADYPARPEWFFRFLFQMLKYFPGRLEWVGSIVIPGALFLTMASLPILDKILPSRFVHFLACCLVFVLAGGAGYLTLESFREDANNPKFQEARAQADQARERALFLASSPEVGVPPEGSGYLMRLDPPTRGRAIMDKRCLVCHRFGGVGDEKWSAADLKNFGTKEWVRGLLENPDSDDYFGKTPECDGMAEWKQSSKLTAEQLDQVADFVAGFAKIPEDFTVDEWLDQPEVANHPGNKLFQKDCGSCHLIEGYTEGGLRDAPDLFAWGSPQWMGRMIRRPQSPVLYGYLGDDQRMPASPRDEMTDNDLKTVIRYLMNDYPLPTDKPKEEAVAAQP